MSKFFSPADEEESDREELLDEQEPVLVQPKAKGKKGKTAAVKEKEKEEMVMFDSSSDDDEKRVVRSEKDKRFDAMQSSVRTIHNMMKVNDFSSMKDEYELLIKLVEKSQRVIEKSGHPDFLVQFFMDIETFINDAFENRSKIKLSGKNQKNMNVLRQRIKKYNKELEPVFEKYEQSLKDKEQEGSDEEDSEQEVEEAQEEEEDVEQEEEDMEGESDASEESDDEFDLQGKNVYSRDFWVRKEVLAARKAGKDTVSVQKEKIVEEKKESTEVSHVENKDWETSDIDVENRKQKKKLVEDIAYSAEMIETKLNEILGLRGKRGINRSQIIEDLTLLSTKTKSPLALLKIKTTLLSSMFDFNLNKSGFIPTELWKKAASLLNEVVHLLMENSNIRLAEGEDIEETPLSNPTQESEGIDASNENKIAYVAGSLFSYLLRLSDEFNKCLLETDSFSEEYLDRFNDEVTILKLAAIIQRYYEKLGLSVRLCETAMLRAEYLYCKYMPSFDAFNEEHSDNVILEQDIFTLESTVFHGLCGLLFEKGDDRMKTRAMTMLVYGYSMHNRFHKARNVLLMSHVQEHITQADISSQILYNRAIAQFGLCAFRCGFYREALQVMSDLYATGKVKEILAQGVSSKYDGQDQIIQLEKSHQIPYHLHISLDLLDAVHVLSAMILEVPQMALNPGDDRRHMLSRNFRRLWDNYNKSVFNGPPENTRDCAIAASKALFHGNWKKAIEYISKMKFWSLIKFADTVQSRLFGVLKEVALRTYLIRYGSMFVTISVERLTCMFEMPRSKIHPLICKMIMSDELEASWDKESDCIFISAANPNPIQQSVMELTGRVTQVLEQNERVLEYKSGASTKEKASAYKKAKNVGLRGNRAIGSMRPIRPSVRT